MISSIVPAQITTIEDKIAGNLSLQQIILLMIPVCVSTLLIVICPPILKLAIYKLIIALMLGLATSLLAIRWHNELILNRLRRMLTFFARPSIYLLCIRPSCNCNQVDLKVPSMAEGPIEFQPQVHKDEVTVSDLFRLNGYLIHESKGFLTDKEGRVSAIYKNVS